MFCNSRDCPTLSFPFLLVVAVIRSTFQGKAVKVNDQHTPKLFIPSNIVTPKILVDDPQGFDFLVHSVYFLATPRRQLRRSWVLASLSHNGYMTNLSGTIKEVILQRKSYNGTQVPQAHKHSRIPRLRGLLLSTVRKWFLFRYQYGYLWYRSV